MKYIFIFILILVAEHACTQENYYYPPLDFNDEWTSTNPLELNWCPDNIDSLYSFLDENHTKGFIILKSGRIVLEKYFDSFSKDSLWYWASAAKSLTAVLIGLAQEEGLLNIQDPTSEFLGTGWTQMDSSLEANISIVHQLSMTTGLDDMVNDLDCLDPECLDYFVPPGTRWSYHNAPYRLLLDVIESASGKGINVYTDEKLRTTIGMRGFWFGYIRYSRTRDLARFGHLILSNGTWAGDTILYDTAYLNKMVQPSQDMNPAYGYLWWLNGQDSYMYPRINIPFNGPLFPSAPTDMFSAQGKNDQKIYVIPSQDMVVVRVGHNALDIPFLSNVSFDNDLWKLINMLPCSSTSTNQTTLDENIVEIYPNPTSGWTHFIRTEFYQPVRYHIYDLNGRVVRRGIWEAGNVQLVLNLTEIQAGLYYFDMQGIPQIKFIKG